MRFEELAKLLDEAAAALRRADKELSGIEVTDDIAKFSKTLSVRAENVVMRFCRDRNIKTVERFRDEFQREGYEPGMIRHCGKVTHSEISDALRIWS